MRIILSVSSKNINYFSTINAQYLKNKLQNAVRFQSQNINWDFDELNYQAVALTKGLTSLKFKTNDNFLIRIPSNQQAQGYISRLGTAGINANLIVSKGKSVEQIGQELQKNNVSCFIFEPTLAIGQNSLIDALQTLSPELKNHFHGASLNLKRFPYLKALVQTNFYSYPGVYKFRAIMNYASNKFYKLDQQTSVQPFKIPESQKPLIITDPTSLFAYRAGILNSVVNGRYVVCVESKDVNRVCSEIYNNEVDLIGTQQIGIDAKIRVFVQKGSELYKGKGSQSRVQI